MGTTSGRSKYDRIRMTFFLDVLVGKDLFDEGRVNAGILPRGIPTGITEGAGSGVSSDACEVCESKEKVGQHKLSGDDHDDARENTTDADDQTRKQRYETVTELLVTERTQELTKEFHPEIAKVNRNSTNLFRLLTSTSFAMLELTKLPEAQSHSSMTRSQLFLTLALRQVLWIR